MAFNRPTATPKNLEQSSSSTAQTVMALNIDLKESLGLAIAPPILRRASSAPASTTSMSKHFDFNQEVNVASLAVRKPSLSKLSMNKINQEDMRPEGFVDPQTPLIPGFVLR